MLYVVAKVIKDWDALVILFVLSLVNHQVVSKAEKAAGKCRGQQKKKQLEYA